ncbi:MAG: hypothetical protein ABW318_22680 [Vicinamibacterales bacterium]
MSKRLTLMVQVLPQYYTPDADIYAVYPYRHQRSKRDAHTSSFSPSQSRSARPAACTRSVRDPGVCPIF